MKKDEKIKKEEHKRGEEQKKCWEDFFASKILVSDDFLADRGDTIPQERDLF